MLSHRLRIAIFLSPTGSLSTELICTIVALVASICKTIVNQWALILGRSKTRHISKHFRASFTRLTNGKIGATTRSQRVLDFRTCTCNIFGKDAVIAI